MDIDAQRRWAEEPPRLQPVERRPLYAPVTLRCQVYVSDDSVVLVRLALEGENA